ncbi:MAG: sel1 repeat family protein [Pseudomonadales bacterium]|nr:sel1 repeat family protein [Pseudomonadales bacterium]
MLVVAVRFPEMRLGEVIIQNKGLICIAGAEQGDALAAFRLALLVEDKKVDPGVYGSAGDWYNRSCELGGIVSCHNAAVGYENGSLGLPKDYAKARTLYLKGANKGYLQSQYNVDGLYANKYFNDDIEGLKWFLLANKAARLCQSDSLCSWILSDPPGHMKKLRGRMSKEQIEKAVGLADSAL